MINQFDDLKINQFEDAPINDWIFTFLFLMTR
jgi:hypothetical protein